ncbi:MAG: 3'-5' exonuclease domain-containing protein 2 [Halobacteriovoraceae bacterium]|jgi:ribonuclease D|nr:3'-5' exonuclease domain-containing protein 2 [Halobacteriovoraceae bacterium]
MKYQLSISKDEINELPLYVFNGTIKLIESTGDALVAVEQLKQEKVLGFDTETRAAFKKGERYDVSMLQLATNSCAYLFRLNKFKLMPELVAILADPNIVKAGVAVRDDIKGLQKLLAFEATNFVELADVAQEKKIKNFGLRALTGILLKKRLSKRAKISNWELTTLTPAQISYAACDAVVGVEIYQAFTDSNI